jgi:hypothetical protein
MEETAAFEPARHFVLREPDLALRLILARDGAVHRVLAEGFARSAREARGPAGLPDSQVHILIQVATALVWATFVVGDDPEIDSAAQLIEAVLRASA